MLKYFLAARQLLEPLLLLVFLFNSSIFIFCSLVSSAFDVYCKRDMAWHELPSFRHSVCRHRKCHHQNGLFASVASRPHLATFQIFICPYFFLAGEMIIAGDRYALTEKENNMYAIEMILHIRRLQSTDFGGYKCISKNSIGDTEGTIRLYGKLTRVDNMN